MPILSPEPNVYPSDLLVAVCAGGAAAADRCWWLLYTRARQEKSLARELYQRQIPFYLPLTTRTLRIHGRPAKSLVPLFPGYLFVFASADERVAAQRTNRVVHALPVQDQATFQTDLRNVQRLVNTGQPLVAETERQPYGQAQVRSGGLQGLAGTLLKRGDQLRLLVWFDVLQLGISLAVDETSLESLRDS